MPDSIYLKIYFLIHCYNGKLVSLSYKYKGMKKTSATRYLELLHGLFIVKDCLKLISEGRDYHIITISGQLRGIFLDTDKEKRKALFFEVMDYFRLAPIVYINSLSEQKFPIEGLVLKYGINYPQLRPTRWHTKSISIEEWLDLPILQVKGKELSSKSLIRLISDRFGGAHYDSKIEKWNFDLKNMQVFNVKVLDNALIQLSELLLHLAWEVIRPLSNWSYCFEFGIRYNKLEEPKNIISFHQGTSYNSVYFILQIDKSLIARFVSPWGKTFEISILDKVDFDINSIGINYYISPEFEYCLDIANAGKVYKQIKLPYPIFIDARLFKYKTISYGDDGLTVGFMNHAQYTNVLNKEGFANLYQMFIKQRKKVDVFTNQYKTIKDNDYEKQISDNYKVISYEEWLKL